MSFGPYVVLATALWLALSPLAGAAAPEVRFNQDVRPILSQQCFPCHGPDQNKRKAKLRLDQAEDALAPHKGGRPIVPGKPEESELIRRINSRDPEEQMPPPPSGKTLTDQQRGLLRTWIQEGARYEGHWAFMPLTRPDVPERKAGAMTDAVGENPIDAFIQARLDRESLVLSPEADRHTLIRRVSFDLTGLLLRAEEVEAFIKSRDPRAYEKLVDRLLNSPRYGERMASYWLDLVRYGDTVGYHGDCDYSVWPYRDYVIRAFNENYSFDRFTREQLAGDLLPNATVEQRVASGYNRLNRVSTEGGVQDKEYLAKYASDRVRTTSTIWLGATIGCAECHDHKFDPFSTRDFYRFAAFFADLKEKGFYDKGFSENDWGPRMSVPSPAQEKELQSLDTRLGALKKKRDAFGDEQLAGSRARWESRVLAWAQEKSLGWTNVAPVRLNSRHGARLEIQTNLAVLVSGPLPDDEEYTAIIPVPLARVTALRLEVLKDSSLPGNDLARSGQMFVLAEIEVGVGSLSSRQFQRVILRQAAADFAYDGFPALAAIDGRLDTGWSQGSGPPRDRRAVFQFAEPLRGGSNMLLSVRLRHNPHYPRQHIGKFRLALASMDDPNPDPQGLPEDVLKALKVLPAQRTNDQSKTIAGYFRTIAPELRGLQHQIAALQTRRDLLAGAVPTMLVSQTTKPRPIRVLPRGNWMNDSGDIVQPGVPHFLRQLEPAARIPAAQTRPDQAADEARATRLDLANWFAAPDNPLTARVFVNRFWKLFFGTGLSKNLDDLGAQGEWPTHPELLDWLACEFGQPSGHAGNNLTSSPRLPGSADDEETSRSRLSACSGRWDVKHLVRLIVTSRTYRQTSRSSSLLDEKDPFNRLLARQSRFRLDAEMVRDNALAVAGLLVDRQGGPSVRPYQPEGYYASLNFPRREYVASQGDELYRRSLYTHWQRTFLHPSLLAFDATPREECTVARVNSNTPLQALVLLNDPIYVEAARVFAENILRHGGSRFERRIDWAFMRALARPARPEEQQRLADLYAKQRARFDLDPHQAGELIQTGEFRQATRLNPVELAAWVSVARVILNLHEVITRD